MRPVTRRVTAQRKFAQGAFVPSFATAAPPAAVVVSNGSVERTSSNQDKYTVHISNMSTEVMLDVACFENSHTHQPIVILERMPDPEDLPLNITLHNHTPTTTIQQATEAECSVQSKQQGRKTAVKKKVHVMKLRSRKSKRISKSKTRSKRRAQPVRVQSAATQPALPGQTKRKSVGYVYEFTLDDNRPLKYLATTSTSDDNTLTLQSQSATRAPTIQQKEGVNVPRGRAPVDPSPGSSREPDKSITEKRAQSESDSSISLHYEQSDVKEEEVCGGDRETSPLLNRVVSTAADAKSSKAGKQKSVAENQQTADTPRPPVTKLANDIRGVHNLRSVTEEPIVSGVQNNVACKNQNYYNEQVIHRWMDNSLTDNGKTVPSAATDGPDAAVQNVNGVSGPVKQCYSVSWHTVDDVLSASNIEYNSRCRTCTNCELIQKYTSVCKLLKIKYNIDDIVGNTSSEIEIPEWNALPVQKDTKDPKGNRSSPKNSSKTLFVELIPRHPNIMIKLRLQTSNHLRGFYISLVPRSKLNTSDVFVFASHDVIINTLLKSLNVVYKHPPLSNTVARIAPGRSSGSKDLGVDQEPVAGPSGLQNMPHAAHSGEIEIIELEDDGTDDGDQSGKILDAPTYYPTREEFQDPMAYFEKIKDQLVKYGICKIVPPAGFKPPCKLDDDVTFEVSDQYITRMYNRWGSATRELCAIRKCHAASQVSATRRPMIDGIEVNLPKLYHLVQRYGGLETVMNKNKWCKIGEEMNLVKGPATARKLDQIYVTFLLPYETLRSKQRQDVLSMVEVAWQMRLEKIMSRVNNPLYRQQAILDGSVYRADDIDDDITKQTEDCVIPGVSMNLAKFKKISLSALSQFLGTKAPSTTLVEDEYWNIVILASEHVCVNTASIDTSEQGIGFPTNSDDPYSNHKWNLKMLSQNPKNLLRCLGPVLGVTVPTLHLGMVYSSSCWHRDPHSIPWIEYEHSGPPKLWYSVPEKEGPNFCSSSKTLFPMSCQNKDLWLSSDISMIPPNLLAQKRVRVYRVEQNPGEFVLVMPNAYSCSICTGYTVSESVYFATETLLDGLIKAFKEIRKSCEPAMFTLEQLLWAISEDPSTSRPMLLKIKPVLDELFNEEIKNRTCLESKGVRCVKGGASSTSSKNQKGKPTSAKPAVWNVRDLDECDICRCSLYLSKVKNIPQRDSFMCLEHSLVYIKCRQRIDIHQLEMDYIIPTEQLKGVMDKLRLRLERAS